MDGFGETLNWFSENNVLLEVPFFQRPYVWNEENWQNLLASIESSDERKMPFIGSFILQQKSENSNEYWIIDGQQRIITLSILIKAVLNHNKKMAYTISAKLEKIAYIVDAVDVKKISRKTRLIPSNADSEDFEKVMFDNEIQSNVDGKSKIKDCYQFLKNYVDNLDE